MKTETLTRVTVELHIQQNTPGGWRQAETVGIIHEVL